jgi:hypothetical protein
LNSAILSLAALASSTYCLLLPFLAGISRESIGIHPTDSATL